MGWGGNTAAKGRGARMADPNNRCSAPPSWQRSPVPKRAPWAGCRGGGGPVGAGQGFGNAWKSAARVRRAPRLGGPAKRRCGPFLFFLPGTAARQACPAPSAGAGLGGRVGRWKRSGRARRRAGEACQATGRNMAAPSSALPPSYEESTSASNPAPYPYPPAGGIPVKGAPAPCPVQAHPPFPPQSYGMQPQPVRAVPPVPVHTVYIPGPLVFLEHPMQIHCPACNQMIVTRISYQPGALAWLSCGGLALVGCWLGCCLIPFCVDAMQDVQHFCPCCNAFLGVHKRL
ncbi:lipopolysaccharide-induced tumor necrosis factor-alpha factor isoform X1 [Crotalus tigris]|nr:lipopolysaccharide-induced tumor necrosis factor-alpha factor isoform X1 [Crotalus tigris]